MSFTGRGTLTDAFNFSLGYSTKQAQLKPAPNAAEVHGVIEQHKVWSTVCGEDIHEPTSFCRAPGQAIPAGGHHLGNIARFDPFKQLSVSRSGLTGAAHQINEHLSGPGFFQPLDLLLKRETPCLVCR